ncbi:MAG: hypothetical protein MJZ15_11070 [Bacteroidales bacterium]|nr:hypothetical protein [Bacteroidales bacterium]
MKKQQNQQEALCETIANEILNIELDEQQQKALIRERLKFIRKMQFITSGFNVVHEIDKFNMSRSARFKLIKCFANHHAIDDTIVDFVFTSIETNVLAAQI